jgi:hypothetical protein
MMLSKAIRSLDEVLGDEEGSVKSPATSSIDKRADKFLHPSIHSILYESESVSECTSLFYIFIFPFYAIYAFHLPQSPPTPLLNP